MKVPYSWLKEYVDIDISAEELEDPSPAVAALLREIFPK